MPLLLLRHINQIRRCYFPNARLPLWSSYTNEKRVSVAGCLCFVPVIKTHGRMVGMCCKEGSKMYRTLIVVSSFLSESVMPAGPSSQQPALCDGAMYASGD
jgi:hypothetical protein